MKSTICQKCGITRLDVYPGTGPHYGMLCCSQCGGFIKWLSRDEVDRRGGFTVQQGNLFEVQP